MPTSAPLELRFRIVLVPEGKDEAAVDALLQGSALDGGTVTVPVDVRFGQKPNPGSNLRDVTTYGDRGRRVEETIPTAEVRAYRERDEDSAVLRGIPSGPAFGDPPTDRLGAPGLDPQQQA